MKYRIEISLEPSKARRNETINNHILLLMTEGLVAREGRMHWRKSALETKRCSLFKDSTPCYVQKNIYVNDPTLKIRCSSLKTQQVLSVKKYRQKLVLKLFQFLEKDSLESQ